MDQNAYDKEDDDDICSEEEELDDNFDYTDYYSTNEFDYECAQLNKDKEDDPEYFDYNCLTVQQTQAYINKLVDEICGHIQVSYSIGKVGIATDVHHQLYSNLSLSLFMQSA